MLFSSCTKYTLIHDTQQLSAIADNCWVEDGSKEATAIRASSETHFRLKPVPRDLMLFRILNQGFRLRRHSLFLRTHFQLSLRQALGFFLLHRRDLW